MSNLRARSITLTAVPLERPEGQDLSTTYVSLTLGNL